MLQGLFAVLGEEFVGDGSGDPLERAVVLTGVVGSQENGSDSRWQWSFLIHQIGNKLILTPIRFLTMSRVNKEGET